VDEAVHVRSQNSSRSLNSHSSSTEPVGGVRGSGHMSQHARVGRDEPDWTACIREEPMSQRFLQQMHREFMVCGNVLHAATVCAKLIAAFSKSPLSDWHQNAGLTADGQSKSTTPTPAWFSILLSRQSWRGTRQGTYTSRGRGCGMHKSLARH
jgi:hypothetical protein